MATAIGGTHDGYGLSGLHTIARFNQILRIVAVYRFQAVVMTYNNDIAIRGIIL